MDASKGVVMTSKEFEKTSLSYFDKLHDACQRIPLNTVEELAIDLLNCWSTKKQVFIFGNGGSAGNAIHLANDFLYGISKEMGNALKIHALPANTAVITCLANDEGYDNIFSSQLAVMGNPGDIAIALSGSGNSANILKALEVCQAKKIKSYAILGFSGGKALDLANRSIHIPINDMQISEDLQLIIGHLLMQWLYKHKINP